MKRLLVPLTGIILAGCAPGTKREIVVYSPHGKEMLSAFARSYEAANPADAVHWLDMGSQDAFDRVRTEKENPQADIWWGGPMTAFARAEHEGLLARYVPSWDSVADPSLRSPSREWYGTFLTPEVIMYNREKIDSSEAPRDWDDLLAPAWRGKIVIRSPLASGTMRIIFCSMIMRQLARGGTVATGLDWLRHLDANTKTYAADPTQLYIAIARQEGLLTLWDLPDVMLQAEVHGEPFAYVVPAGGTPVITDGIAIVKGAPHPEAAARFYEFVTSRSSMVRQAREFFRIPARKDIPPADLPAWMRPGGYRALPLDVDTLALHEKEWMRDWDETVRGRGAGGS
ncbi:MAG TPA: extracellular solute-binding protein [Bacteroidota bacterium]|nr:extracellular solute-binding protein [Bacteroidota bacterium]